VLIGIAVLVLLVLALAVWLLRRPSHIADDVDRFTAARALTTGWAADPRSAPRPVLDSAAALRRSGTPAAEAEPTDQGEPPTT
jgi:hypothetical protein